MDVQILSGDDADNVRPYLEQCRVTRPDGIMEENLGGDEGAVVWAKGRDESLGEGDVGLVVEVEEVDYFDCVGPVIL